MKKIIYVISIALIATLIVLAYIIYLNKFKIDQPSQNKAVGTETFTVELQIHDSVAKSLVIQNDGTMILKEGDKTSQIKISPQDVESLKKYISDNNLFSLKERYEGRGCNDCVAHTLIVTMGDTTHTAYCYDECPKKFSDIVEKIKSLWPEKIQYVGFS